MSDTRNAGWLRSVTRAADQTGPRSVSPHDFVIAVLSRVRDANNRLVMAEAEIERARIEYEEARFQLAHLLKDYGILALVDGKEPPTPTERDE